MGAPDKPQAKELSSGASVYLQWSCPGEEGVFASSLVILWGNKTPGHSHAELHRQSPSCGSQVGSHPSLLCPGATSENSLAVLSCLSQDPPSAWPPLDLFYIPIDDWHWSPSNGRPFTQVIKHGLRAIQGWARFMGSQHRTKLLFDSEP